MDNSSIIDRHIYLKQRIDDRFRLLEWDKDKQLAYIFKHFEVRSRLALTDEQNEVLNLRLRILSEDTEELRVLTEYTEGKFKARKSREKRRRD